MRRLPRGEVRLGRAGSVARLLAVVGQAGRRDREVERGEVVGHHAVHPHAVRAVDALVGDVADDRAREEQTTARPALDQAALLERVELVVELLAGQHPQLVHPHAGARHREPAQRVALGLGQLREPRRDHVLEGGGQGEGRARAAHDAPLLPLALDPDRAAVEQGVDELDQEEGVPAGAVDDGLLDVLGHGRAPEARRDQRPALGVVELREVDARDAPEDLLDPLVLAARDDHHQRHVVGAGHEPRHQRQARRVDELQRVDPDHERPLGREPAEQVPDRAGEPRAAVGRLLGALELRRDQRLEGLEVRRARLRADHLAQDLGEPARASSPDESSSIPQASRTSSATAS